MVESIGIDIVEVDRMRADLERYGDRFLKRILSPEERAIMTARADQGLFLAGRFACKEAVVKALGRYLTERPALSEISITNDSTGQPFVTFTDAVQARLGKAKVMVSISHEHSHAVAMALICE